MSERDEIPADLFDEEIAVTVALCSTDNEDRLATGESR